MMLESEKLRAIWNESPRMRAARLQLRHNLSHGLPSDIEVMPTVLTPAVSLVKAPETPRPLIHETQALPVPHAPLAVEKSIEELIRDAVQQFMDTRPGIVPNMVLVSLLRLLTIPSQRWDRYPVRVQVGYLEEIMVSVRSTMVVGDDMALALVRWDVDGESILENQQKFYL